MLSTTARNLSLANPPPCLWHQWSAHKAPFSLALSLSPGPPTPTPASTLLAAIAQPASVFFTQLVTVFLCSFFMVFGVPLGPIFYKCSDFCLIKKTCQFSNRFSDVIFIDFGVPKPPRFSSRPHETLKIKNTRFPFLTPFWMHVGFQNGCKILPIQ